ncbi:MAG: hypothetical protein ACR2GO_04995 [Candidatus Limnocylindria bacterium]
MTLRIRHILALSILVIVLAACGTTVGAPTSETPAPSEPAVPSVEPSVTPSQAPAEPSEPVAEEREVAGILTVAEMAYSGPGGTIQEALDIGPTGDLPTLVRGVLFRDTDGTVYLATSVSAVTAPTFDGPMLEVRNIPNDGPSWDIANAEMLGIEEANGIVFNQDSTILGYLELP